MGYTETPNVTHPKLHDANASVALSFLEPDGVGKISECQVQNTCYNLVCSTSCQKYPVYILIIKCSIRIQ